MPHYSDDPLYLASNAAKTSYIGVCQIVAADLRVHAPCYHQPSHSLIHFGRRKFFGRPTGSSPKPQQSKLAFQKPHTTKAVKEEHEEVDGVVKAEDCEEADAVKNDLADEDVNMDSKSEAHKSVIGTKQADSVMNGMDEVDSALANGKGELSI